MPNGKPHDHPVIDTVIHGLHPFPPDVEDLVRQVHARNPGVFDDLGPAPFEWERATTWRRRECFSRDCSSTTDTPRCAGSSWGDTKRLPARAAGMRRNSCESNGEQRLAGESLMRPGWELPRICAVRRR
jgi:hypothetical protein